jgi:hypothetical protein
MASILKRFQKEANQTYPDFPNLSQEEILHEQAVAVDMEFSRGELVKILELQDDGKLTNYEMAVFETLTEMM